MASNPPPRLFDRALLRRRRDRAAAAILQHDFLLSRAAADLWDRVESVTRDFPLALALGGAGVMDRTLSGHAQDKVGALVQADFSPRMAVGGGLRLAADEEALPFADAAFDLVLAPLSLHWTNDLPGVLAQINRALKPDGFFACALFGGATLTELRQSLLAAEAEQSGGASPRVSPFADAQDMGALLQRAGFTMPVSDVDRVTVRYADMFGLLRDLRGMGETSILAQRPRKPAARGLFLRAAEIYADRFSDPDGRVRATFEIIHAAGWAPHPDQPRPKRPGSATHRLADALGAKEIKAGEKAGRRG
ncbi:MAG: methyltransferase domain-containing protein [Maricaulaceae bacterium]|nr:methyltransferase domain-containing protein [Maricaulaceae bacterium]